MWRQSRPDVPSALRCGVRRAVCDAEAASANSTETVNPGRGLAVAGIDEGIATGEVVVASEGDNELGVTAFVGFGGESGGDGCFEVLKVEHKLSLSAVLARDEVSADRAGDEVAGVAVVKSVLPGTVV